MANSTVLDDLAEIVGIASEYTDKSGQVHITPEETKLFFLKAMGIPAATPKERETSLKRFKEMPWKRRIAPTTVVLTDEFPASCEISLPDGKEKSAAWRIVLENGEELNGSVDLKKAQKIDTATVNGVNYSKYKAVLMPELPVGYHKLTVTYEGVPCSSSLLVAPPKGYTPEGMSSFKSIDRIWGVPVQLYALRSERNWGIGDFTDLSSLLDILKRQGADIIGLNPLNALFHDNPGEASPYRPSSRLYLNPLYIDVEAVPEFSKSAKAQELVHSFEFQMRLQNARKTKLVDYQCVSDLKTRALGAVYETFKELYDSQDENDCRRHEDFEVFKREHTPSLDELCTFEALREKIGNGFPAPGQKDWPEGYRRADTPEVRVFAMENEDRINFFKFIHWIADRQLAAVYEKSKALKFKIGLYQDQAVGVASDGAEPWAHPSSFVKGVDIGAPPDQMRPRGQRWGFATPNPLSLNEDSYMHYRDLMRFNMKYAGALRIDHVMGLYRLFWAPELNGGEKVVNGAYIRYSMRTLLAIIAIESQRAKCIVIGEDLGTVPKGFRGKMYQARLFSTKVLHRQRDRNGAFFPTTKYFPFSLAQVSTHDQPSIPAYWTFYDLDTFKRCNLFLSREQYEKACEERLNICKKMIESFKSEGLWADDVPSRIDIMKDPRLRRRLITTTNRFIARTKSSIFLVRFEDIFGQTEMINVPGTTNEYPNWRLKLPLNITEMENSPEMQEVLTAIREERNAVRQSKAS